MIVGVAGRNASGKDTVGDILKEQGFQHLDFGHEIREYLRKNSIDTARQNQIDAANKMRKEHGPDFWARKLMKRVEPGKNYVIVSIRNPAEARALQELDDFRLIKIEADQKKRFEFVKKRLSEGDRLNDGEDTFEEFKRMDDLEYDNPDPAKQSIKKVMDLANYTIENDGTLEELKQKVLDFVEA